MASAPSPSYDTNAPPSSQSISGGGGGGSGGNCGPSPAYSNASGHSWETDVYSYGNNLASPVHSPGWPSPRATEGGLMQLPLPPTPTNSSAAGAATNCATFPTMPPSAPSRGGVKGDAVGVAWLAKTNTTKATKATVGVEERTAGAVAAVANSAFYGQEHSPSPATKGRLWAERVKAG
ncbi:unnamed protein product, partial [Hapterophycus canaliculatus]